MSNNKSDDVSIVPKNFVWTDEADAIVKRMREEGYSASVIGNALGVTRNSVIGRVHRLKLPSSANTSKKLFKKRSPKPRRARPDRTTPFQPSKVALPPASIEIAPSSITLLDVPLLETDSFHCRWIEGDARINPTVCGHIIHKGSYCAYHARIVYEPARKTWGSKTEAVA